MKALTTLIAAVGDGMRPAVARLSSAANVSVADVTDVPDDPVTAMATAASVWRDAARRSAIYTVVAMDPLAPVVEQWAARLTGRPEQLELAIGLVGDIQTPDYYLVAPHLPDPQVHWYTAHVRSLAPSRVIVCEAHPSIIATTLAGLPFGRALPSLSELATSARDFVPLAGDLERASGSRLLEPTVLQER